MVHEVASPGPFWERLFSLPVLLQQPYSLLSHTCNPRSFIYLRTLFRDGAPATRLESAASTLFLSSQGVASAKGHFLFSSTYIKRTNHESSSTQLQLGCDAGKSRSEVPSRHRLRTAVPPSRHPLRPLFSPCHFATAISSTRRGRPFRRLPR